MRRIHVAWIAAMAALLLAVPLHGTAARAATLHRLTPAGSGATVQAAIGDVIVLGLVNGSGYTWTSATSSAPGAVTALTTGGADLGDQVEWDVVGAGVATIAAVAAPHCAGDCPASLIRFSATVVVAGDGQSASAAAASAASPTSGPSAAYLAGYNLVGVPSSTTLPVDAYRLDPASGSYVSVVAGTPLSGGTGYLAYFPAATTVPLASPGAASAQVSVPGGSYALVGNPSATGMATISGADLVQVYNAALQTYLPQLEPLPPGGAALVYAAQDATVTIIAAAP